MGLANEVKKLKAEVQAVAAPEGSFLTKMKRVAKSGWDWFTKGGWQQVVAFGAAFLADPENSHVLEVADGNVVPAGTILKVIPIRPNYFTDDENIEKSASMFTFYEFINSHFEFEGLTSSENATGSIAAFINTDPTLVLALNSPESVRQCVQDYNGVIMRTDKKYKLKVPVTQNKLYTDGSNAGLDPRFTTQGDLYIVAFTDLDMSVTNMNVSFRYNLSLGKSGNSAFQPVVGITNPYAVFGVTAPVVSNTNILLNYGSLRFNLLPNTPVSGTYNCIGTLGTFGDWSGFTMIGGFGGSQNRAIAPSTCVKVVSSDAFSPVIDVSGNVNLSPGVYDVRYDGNVAIFSSAATSAVGTVDIVFGLTQFDIVSGVAAVQRTAVTTVSVTLTNTVWATSGGALYSASVSLSCFSYRNMIVKPFVMVNSSNLTSYNGTVSNMYSIDTSLSSGANNFNNRMSVFPLTIYPSPKTTSTLSKQIYSLHTHQPRYAPPVPNFLLPKRPQVSDDDDIKSFEDMSPRDEGPAYADEVKAEKPEQQAKDIDTDPMRIPREVLLNSRSAYNDNAETNAYINAQYQRFQQHQQQSKLARRQSFV